MRRAAVLTLGVVGLAAPARAAVFYAGLDRVALGLVAAMAVGFAAGIAELVVRVDAADAAVRALRGLPATLTEEALAAAPPRLQAALRARIDRAPPPASPAPFAPYLVGGLVMLGLLGTFLGLFETLRAAREALAATADVEGLRAGLSQPLQGLARSFGTSAAGVAASAALGLAVVVARRAEGEASAAVASYAARAGAPLGREQRQIDALLRQGEALATLVRQGEALATMARQGEALATLVAQGEALAHRQEGIRADARAAVDEVRDALTTTVERAVASAHQALAPLAERLVRDAAAATDGHLAEVRAALQMERDEARARDEAHAQRVEAWLLSTTRAHDARATAQAEREDAAARAHEARLLAKAELDEAAANERAQRDDARAAAVAAREDARMAAAAEREDARALRSEARDEERLARAERREEERLAKSEAREEARLAKAEAREEARLAAARAAWESATASRGATTAAVRAHFEGALEASRAALEAQASRVEALAIALGEREERRLAQHARAEAERAQATAEVWARASEALAGGTAMVREHFAAAMSAARAEVEAAEQRDAERRQELAQFFEASRASLETVVGASTQAHAGLSEALLAARTSAEHARASGDELTIVAQAFGAAVERHREGAAEWATALVDVEAAVARAGEGTAAVALDEALGRMHELFEGQLQVQRELFHQLRALRGDDDGALSPARPAPADAAPRTPDGASALRAAQEGKADAVDGRA